MPNDKVLELVRNLLARAEHPNTPGPESELCYAQANKLMTKHAIDEALLDSTRTESERHKATKIDIMVGYSSAGEFYPKMRTLLMEIAETNRCKAIISPKDFTTIEIYGFAEDARWSEMLFTTMLMDFLGNVNPKWDPAKPFEQNIYNHKVAGFKWADIDKIAMQHGHASSQRLKKEMVWVRYDHDLQEGVYEERMVGTGFYNKLHTIYTKYAKTVGDENLVKTTSFDQYREQFTLAFADRMMERLYSLRYSNEEAVKEAGAELALIDRSHLIDEAIWGEHPEMHPDEIAEQNRLWREKKQAEAQKREDMLNAMTKGERTKFLEEEEKVRRRRQKSAQGKVRYVAYQSAASARGASAANSVNLSRKRHTDGRGSQGQIN